MEMLFLMFLIEGSMFNVMLTLSGISSLTLARHGPQYFENVMRISSVLKKLRYVDFDVIVCKEIFKGVSFVSLLKILRLSIKMTF